MSYNEPPSSAPLGSELLLHIPSRHAALYALGEIEIRFIQNAYGSYRGTTDQNATCDSYL